MRKIQRKIDRVVFWKKIKSRFHSLLHSSRGVVLFFERRKEEGENAEKEERNKPWDKEFSLQKKRRRSERASRKLKKKEFFIIFFSCWRKGKWKLIKYNNLRISKMIRNGEKLEAQTAASRVFFFYDFLCRRICFFEKKFLFLFFLNKIWQSKSYAFRFPPFIFQSPLIQIIKVSSKFVLFNLLWISFD